MSPRHRPVAISILALMLACGDGAAPPAERDPDGVFVVRLDLEGMAYPIWRSEVLFATTQLDIPRVGPMPHAVFLSDSSLVLGDMAELVVIDPDARSLRRIGRRGEGPGEFSYIGGVKLAADGDLVISDLNTGRITFMRSTGEVLRVISRPHGANSSREVEVVSALGQGRIISSWSQGRPNRGALEGIRIGNIERDSVPLVVLDAAGERVGGLGEWHGLERGVFSAYGHPARLPLPFARGIVHASRGDVTVISPTDSLDLTVFVDTMRTSRIIAPPTGQPPTQRHLEGWREAVLDWDRFSAQEILPIMAGAPAVPALPSIGPVLVDDQGHVWVGSYLVPGDSVRTWRIISLEGRPVGRIDFPAVPGALMPSTREVLDVYGDLVALLVFREGEPVVEVHRIVR